MNHYSIALDSALHCTAISILGENKEMKLKDAVEFWKQMVNVYEEFLPQLEEVEHIEAIQELIQATKQCHKVRKEQLRDLPEYAETGIDFMNAFYKSADAVQFLMKSNSKYRFDALTVKLRKEEVGLLKVVTINPELIPHDGTMLVNDKGWNRVMCFKDIVFLQASANYTNIHIASGDIYTETKNLGTFEFTLPLTFIKISRSVIINIHFVDKLSRAKDELFLKNGQNFAVTQNGNELYDRLK